MTCYIDYNVTWWLNEGLSDKNAWCKKKQERN